MWDGIRGGFSWQIKGSTVFSLLHIRTTYPWWPSSLAWKAAFQDNCSEPDSLWLRYEFERPQFQRFAFVLVAAWRDVLEDITVVRVKTQFYQKSRDQSRFNLDIFRVGTVEFCVSLRRPKENLVLKSICEPGEDVCGRTIEFRKFDRGIRFWKVHTRFSRRREDHSKWFWTFENGSNGVKRNRHRKNILHGNRHAKWNQAYFPRKHWIQKNSWSLQSRWAIRSSQHKRFEVVVSSFMCNCQQISIDSSQWTMPVYGGSRLFKRKFVDAEKWLILQPIIDGNCSPNYRRSNNESELKKSGWTRSSINVLFFHGSISGCQKWIIQLAQAAEMGKRTEEQYIANRIEWLKQTERRKCRWL